MVDVFFNDLVSQCDRKEQFVTLWSQIAPNSQIKLANITALLSQLYMINYSELFKIVSKKN